MPDVHNVFRRGGACWWRRALSWLEGGSVSIVSGDAVFRELCSRLAADEGVILTNAAAAAQMISTHGNERSQTAARDGTPPVASRSAEPDRVTASTAPPRVDAPEIEVMSTYGDFPILHDLPVDNDRRSAREFVGLNPIVDAWLAAHRKDAQDFGRLRPLASRIMHDDDAR